MKKKLALVLSLMICLFAASCGPALVVDSAGDEPDSNLSDGVCKTVNNDCTLRAAIMEADLSDDISKITFDSNFTINLTSNLPPLTAGNTHIYADGALLDGKNIIENQSYGIHVLDSSANVIQGLKIRNFTYGIYVQADNGEAKHNIIGLTGPTTGNTFNHNVLIYNLTGVRISGQNAFNNTIAGNFIGIGSSGNTAKPNSSYGILIDSGSHHNLIGSLDGYSISEGGNLISGNTIHGIEIYEANSNHISGNFIGTDVTGEMPVPNGGDGIKIMMQSSDNIVGITPSGDGITNLISGNDGIGIKNEYSFSTRMSGNLIGTNIAGTQAIPNQSKGIYIVNTPNCIIGTNGDGVNDEIEGNLISGNLSDGIYILDPESHHAIIAGNKIGTDTTGATALGNQSNGITSGGHYTRIGTNGDGTSDALESNLVSGNAGTGIGISSNNTTVSGNLIGVDISGMFEVGNTGRGIYSSGDNNLIGTDGDGNADLAEKNQISGNGSIAIELNGAQSNTIAGNLVGTDTIGTTAIPNGYNTPGGYGAIHLVNGANNNVIGTNGDGSGDNVEGNLISGNMLRGIVTDGSNNNVIAGNNIGTDISGSSVLGNTLGILIKEGSSHNLIGTNADGTSDSYESNVISGNTESAGIQINSSQNQIAGNYIGTDKSGQANLGNQGQGILITESVVDILIGGSAPKANTIAFNGVTGIYIYGLSVNNIQILSNSIFSNGTHGIDLVGSPQEAGVTQNDPGDLDNGPNDLMNFPVLTEATSIFLSLAIEGDMVNSLPYTSYLVQFFDNESCDSSGYGEGKTYIGSKQVFTDSYGNASFSALYPFATHAGHFITATATAYGKTSEFSACIEVISDENTYSGEIEEDPCGRFSQEDMELTTFDYNPASGLFTLYVKNPEPYPTVGPIGNWEYTAVLGDIPASKCYSLEFDDRVYCDFPILQEYLNTKQKLLLFSNYCFPPFYVTPDVNILTKDPANPGGSGDPEGCHSGLNQRKCISLGGIYNTETSTCFCPRSAD